MSARGWESGGVGAVDIRGWGAGGVVQDRESQDFRSPEVGRYGNGIDYKEDGEKVHLDT